MVTIYERKCEWGMGKWKKQLVCELKSKQLRKDKKIRRLIRKPNIWLIEPLEGKKMWEGSYLKNNSWKFPEQKKKSIHIKMAQCGQWTTNEKYSQDLSYSITKPRIKIKT